MRSADGSLQAIVDAADTVASPTLTSHYTTAASPAQGMLAAAIYVHCSVSPALEKAAAAHPGLPLYVTGHSLGGAVAALLTLLLMHPNVRALFLFSLLAVQSL
jgi:alpha-beta hydrolase superfamily lysophospholipase